MSSISSTLLNNLFPYKYNYDTALWPWLYDMDELKAMCDQKEQKHLPMSFMTTQIVPEICYIWCGETP